MNNLIKCAALVFLVGWGGACLPGIGGGRNQFGLEQGVAECARRLQGVTGDITLLGVRDAEGEASETTRIVEEWLASALLAEQVPLVKVEPEDQWKSTPEVPLDKVSALETEFALVGRSSIARSG